MSVDGASGRLILFRRAVHQAPLEVISVARPPPHHHHHHRLCCTGGGAGQEGGIAVGHMLPPAISGPGIEEFFCLSAVCTGQGAQREVHNAGTYFSAREFCGPPSVKLDSRII